MHDPQRARRAPDHPETKVAHENEGWRAARVSLLVRAAWVVLLINMIARVGVDGVFACSCGLGAEFGW
jgi:hypothetical protein